MMTNWISATCEANNIRIHYTRTGGNKPPLILLHGLMTNGLCWSDLAGKLEQDYDVIMPDARGHGLSSQPNGKYRYGDLAEDINGLINALQLTKPSLLGHSMGGMTAAVLAGMEPAMLGGLILADPTFLSPRMQQEVYSSNVFDQHRQMLTMSFEEIVADGRRRHPQRPLHIIETFARARLQTCMDALDILRPPNPDYKELVRHMKIPGLLIYGDKGVVNTILATELRILNPHLAVEQIPGARHALHLDQPELFYKAIKSFFDAIETRHIH
ncbi:alpha/beta fold hydrolase [Chitinophaga caeni]|nr:alpha/beta hydrolase [Chitinophaga caeni]